MKAAAELKTKPTQHSVGLLRQIGIQPDILVCRTERSLSRDDRAKIALFCNVAVEAVIEEKDKDFSVYEVPMSLVEHGLDQLIVRKLGLDAAELNLDHWRDLLHRLRNPKHEATIAIVGKYSEHRDAYKSIYEALEHAGVAHRRGCASAPCTARPSSGKAPRACWTASTACSCPAGSATAASRAR